MASNKTYVSAVPLTMVRLASGGYQNVLEGDPIAGEAVNPEDLKRLVRKKFLVEAPKGVDKSASQPPAPNADTVDGILAAVGDDKGKANKALDAEKAKGDDARSTLVDKLQAIVDKA